MENPEKEVSVTLNDFKLVVNLFEEMARRGYFREFDIMEDALYIRNKFLKFITSTEETLKEKMKQQQTATPVTDEKPVSTGTAKKGAKK